MKFLLVLLISVFVFANGIQKLSNCKVKLDDGSVIDLSSKDNAANPRSYKDPPFYTYYFNPCTAITCSSSEDTAFCQSDGGSNIYSLGKQSTANFQIDDNGDLIIGYTGGSGNPSTGTMRQSQVRCICSDSESFKYDGEDNQKLLYMATFQSVCCCPNKCGGGSGGKSGNLSGGSIFLIVFFSSLLAYLLFGAIFMKFQKNASGFDVIPNRLIWIAFIDNIKTGVQFISAKLRGSKSGYQNF